MFTFFNVVRQKESQKEKKIRGAHKKKKIGKATESEKKMKEKKKNFHSVFSVNEEEKWRKVALLFHSLFHNPVERKEKLKEKSFDERKLRVIF